MALFCFWRNVELFHARYKKGLLRTNSPQLLWLTCKKIIELNRKSPETVYFQKIIANLSQWFKTNYLSYAWSNSAIYFQWIKVFIHPTLNTWRKLLRVCLKQLNNFNLACLDIKTILVDCGEKNLRRGLYAWPLLCQVISFHCHGRVSLNFTFQWSIQVWTSFWHFGQKFW